MASEPRYPSTLAPAHYYNGLEERITSNILPTLKPYFEAVSSSSSTSKCVLELASGTGVHAKLYSEQFPVLTFQPTEADAYMVAQCNDGTSETDKVSWCRKLDVLEEEDWKGIEDIAEKEGKFDLVLMSNALHMIPFPAGPEAMFQHFEGIVAEGGHFLVYGPFKHDKGFFGTSDEKFDAMIRARENGEALGLRSVDALDRLARVHGWELAQKHSVPLGNWVLDFARAEGSDETVRG